jgi:hypothetical protein
MTIEAVKDEELETWSATCDKRGCGGFTTRNHETKKAAIERIEEHQREPHFGEGEQSSEEAESQEVED